MAHSLTTLNELQALPKDRTIVLNFWAPWSEPCPQMNVVFDKLAGDEANANALVFRKVEADSADALAEALKVDAVPTYIFWRSGAEVARIDGADAPQLTQLVEKFAAAAAAASDGAAADAATAAVAAAAAAPRVTDEQLRQLTTRAPLMLFMKGTPDEPRCGFSRRAVELLRKHEATFESFDILSDEAIRAALKTYGDWPTYPQLWAVGELVGGLDILNEMDAAGELVPLLRGAAERARLAIDARLKQLIAQRRVVLFMKGTPAQPQCGFSRKAVALLRDAGLRDDAYATFDILGDPLVRAEIKRYSEWPTFPQLYVDGELVGGLDIMKEMAESGELQKTLGGGAAS